MLTIVLRNEGFDTAVVADGSQAADGGARAAARPWRCSIRTLPCCMNGIDASPGAARGLRRADRHADRQDRHRRRGAGAGVRRRRLRDEAVQAQGTGGPGAGAGCGATRTSPPEMLSIADIEIDVPAHKVTREGEQISLTPLEFDLLVALARKPRQVFTREVLLEQVWGYRHPADTRLVNVHVQRLRAKVEKDPENPQGSPDRSRSGIQGRTSGASGEDTRPGPCGGPPGAARHQRGQPFAGPHLAASRCNSGWC